MLLAIDLGNTSMKFALYKKNVISSDFNYILLHKFKLLTKAQTNGSILLESTKKEFSKIKVDICSVKEIVICSVVPSVLNTLKNALNIMFPHIKVFFISGKCNTSINFKNINLSEIGADLISLAQGATKLIHSLKKPCIVASLGTASTFSLIDENNTFLGASIAPGFKTSLDSLINNAELLDEFSDFKPPVKIINTSTKECILSGSIYGYAYLVQGIINKIKKEINKDCNVILTGGYADIVRESLSIKYVYKPDLLLNGMLAVYFLSKQN